MDETAFRTGVGPTGTPVAHGGPAAEAPELRARNAELEARIADMSTQIAGLEAEIAGMRRDHDARVSALLAANSREVNLRRDARRAVRYLDALREAGWSVAVHNDDRQGGARMTFWGFSRGGQWARGEGPTDANALAECAWRACLPGAFQPERVEGRG